MIKKHLKKAVSHQGFTLLELIVAMALMNVIALSLYASMHIGIKAKHSSQSAIKAYRTTVPAFEIIRSDVGSAMTPDGLLAGPFVGEGLQDSDFLSFHTCNYRPREDEAASNIIYIEYQLDEDPELQQTVLKRRKVKNLLSTTAVEPDEEIIARNIAGFDVKYYDGYAWQDAWDSTAQGNTLPWAVKVSLFMASPDTEDDSSQKRFSRIFMIAAANPNTKLQE